MYCRMCGKKIGDTDHFCQFCGASTGHAESPAEPSVIREEIIFNPPYEDKAHKTEEEELKEFISEDEIEEAQQEEVQKNEEPETPEAPKNPEFAWNVYEFPGDKKKTEDVEFNWNMEEYGQPEQPGQKDEKEAFEEELFQEIRDDSSRIKEQNIDRFFTFSKKNEEFQELLDKEYEKLNIFGEPIMKSMKAEPAVEAETAEPVEEAVEAADAEPVKVIRESGIPEAVPLQEIRIELELPVEIPEPEESVLEESVPEEPAAEPEPEQKSEQITEMEKARAQYFNEDLIRDNESIRKKLAFGEPEKENYIETPAIEVPEEIKEPEESEEPEEPIESIELIEPEEPAEPEELVESIELMEREPEEASDNRVEIVAAVYAAAALEKAAGEAETETEVPLADKLDAAFGEEPEEETKHRKSAGQIALTIIAIILAIEIVILGIRYFAPDSSAAKSIGNVQTGIFNTVSGWFGGDGGQKAENSDEQKALTEDSEKTDQDNVQKEEPSADAEKPPVADPNPMADKNALVSSQLGNNKNIEQVKANEALAWQQGKNYGVSDINNAKPITNNIWQAPETGDPVYYDKSVVGTVIAFDSQWIDYVNNSDKSVFELMKKDSEAYRKSVNYTKAGKIKETFKLLEIGEIRQGANGFYIWVHEEIGATENGKASDMKYNWIYYLEPVDGQMKIVNYYHF